MKIRLRYPLWVALLYALLGGLWIIVSDRLAAWLFPNPQLLLQINTYKGWFFIAGTTTLLYLELRREYTRVEQMTVTLRESEKRYHLISENSADVLWTLDLVSQKFTYLSPSVFNLRGLTPEEAMAEPMQASMTPASFEKVSERLPARITDFMAGDLSARSRTTRVDQTRKDGSIVPTEVVTNLITDANGRVVEILGITRDITERKQAENELKESEERFSKAFYSSPVPQAIISQGTSKVMEINDANCRLFGYSREELFDATTSKLNLWENPVDRQSAVEELQKTGRLLPREANVRVRSGMMRTLIAAIEPISWKGIPCFIVSMIDITERKRAEESLRESEKRYRELVQNANSAIIRWKHDGTILFFNEYAQEFFGYKANEVIGKHINIIVPEAESTGGDLTNLVQDIVEHPENFANYVNENICRDGRRVWITWTNRPVCDEQGKVAEILAVGTDITERKQAEEKLIYQANLLANVNDAITASDEHAILKSWNHAAEIMFGWKAEEVIGRPGQDVFRTEFIGMDRKEAFRIVNETGEFRGEMIQYRKDGTQIFVEANTFTVRDEDGNISGYVTTSRDITERKQTESILRESERRFHSLFENMLNGFAYCQMLYEQGRPQDFIYLDVNRAFESLTGLKDVVGKKVSEAIPGIRETDPGLIEAYGKVASTGIPETFEVYVEAMKMWFFISVYSPQKDYFVAVFDVITERKQAEMALREVNDYLENLFNSANAPIIVWDPQFKITRFNEASETLTGRSAAEVLGRPLEILFPASLIQATMRLIQKTLSGERWEGVEISIQHVEGSIRTVLWNSATLFSADGKTPFATIAQGQDITERKLSVEKLLASETRYRRLFEAARDGILILDAETGVIVDVNPFLIEMLGFSYEEICGKELWELGFFKDIVANKANFLELQQKEYIRYDDLPLEISNGRKFHVEFVSNVYQVNHHKVVQCNVRDITARKQAEDAQQQSEILFRALFELSPDAVVLLDPYDPNIASRVVDCNAAACSMNGYERDELIGHSIDIVNADPYTQDGKIAYLKKLRDAGTLKYEVFHRRKNGDVFPVEISTSFIKVGERELVIGIDRDITERKQYEESLQKYNTRLETEVGQRTHELREAQEQLVRQERLATLGQLAGSIGHELRNPLGVISNATYFLKMTQPNASEVVKEYLDIIEKETRTSDKIITDLLDFTRIKSMDRKPVSVSELIRRTLERYPAPAFVAVTLQIPADLPQIYVDPQHVVQVLGNLFTNAYQAMDGVLPKGQELKISVFAEGVMIKVDVQDLGIGIPSENMSKLFEPLFTTKTKGIGLGLAVSRKLSEANGGRIEVESEAGKGSTFTVYLPIYKEFK